MTFEWQNTDAPYRLGSNPGLFPGVVPALCSTIPTMALDIQELLVR